MPGRTLPDQLESARKRLVSLVDRLPEARAVGEGHLSLEVRSRRFGWLMFDHHGDERLSAHLKSCDQARHALIASSPSHFFVPEYVGQHGWVGVWLDVAPLPWELIEEALVDAYLRVAPKSLTRSLHTEHKPSLNP